MMLNEDEIDDEWMMNYDVDNKEWWIDEEDDEDDEWWLLRMMMITFKYCTFTTFSNLCL